MAKRADHIEPLLCKVSVAAAMLGVSTTEVLNLCDAEVLRWVGRGNGRRILISSIKTCGVQGRESLGGNVYVIYWHGYYKIGKAQDVAERLRDIGCSHPVPPTLIKVIPTNVMDVLEAKLHAHFAVKRVSGEWFALDETDLVYLRAYGPYVLNIGKRDEEAA